MEAQRLQREYASQIHILIGFEAEFIRPNCAAHVRKLAEHPIVDYFIGSVHYVHSTPIDYNKDMFATAREASSRKTEESLYEDYYDLQYDMLKELRPRVVGHFDLVRLMSEDPARDVRQWKGVWERILRNLALAREQDGWLEVNSAGLRKGLAEPYPGRIIAEVSWHHPIMWDIPEQKLTSHRNGSNWEASSLSAMTVMALHRLPPTMPELSLISRVWASRRSGVSREHPTLAWMEPRELLLRKSVFL